MISTTAVTPFQQGKAAFSAGATRFDNPYHPHQDGDKRAEWEAGYNHGVANSVIQPETSEYASDVYTQLLVLARSFEENQYFSAAEELRAMAMRGPEQYKGIDQFSTSDLMRATSERLAELGRIAERERR